MLLLRQGLFGGRQAGRGRRHQRQPLVVATVEGRDGQLDQPLDVAQQVAFVVGAEGDRRAFRPGPRGAADAVDIGLGHLRQLVLDDVADAVDVDAARGDVGGDHRPDLALLESGQGALALALALVAMDGRGGDTGLIEILRHTVGAALGAGEDDGAADVLLLHQLGQQGPLARRLDEQQALVDALHRRGDRRHRHLGGVDQHLAGQLADLGRHGGREEQVLPLAAHAADDLADRLQEAEVEHLVGFVEHQDLGGRQVGVALGDVVEQAAGRGDQDVEAAGQGLDLRAVLGAAEDDGDAHVQVLAVATEAFGDLGGQLAGRRQHDAARAAARAGPAVFRQAVQDRQGEGRRLAGAGLGDAEQVLAGQHGRDGLGLDRGRGLIAFGRKGLQDRLGQAQGREFGVGELGHASLS